MTLYLRSKLLYDQDGDLRPINLFEDIEMSVVGNNILGVGSNGAVDKFVVVDVLFYQAEMDIGLLKMGGVQSGNGFHHVVSYLLGGLRGKDFLVLNQNLGVDTKRNVTTQHAFPYLVVWAVGRQGLQEAIGVKYDSTHNDRGYACARPPIG